MKVFLGGCEALFGWLFWHFCSFVVGSSSREYLKWELLRRKRRNIVLLLHFTHSSWTHVTLAAVVNVLIISLSLSPEQCISLTWKCVCFWLFFFPMDMWLICIALTLYWLSYWNLNLNNEVRLPDMVIFKVNHLIRCSYFGKLILSMLKLNSDYILFFKTRSYQMDLCDQYPFLPSEKQ